jgi:hypothetical protein
MAGLTRLATTNTAADALRRLQLDDMVTRLGLGDNRVEVEAFAEWLHRRAAQESS